MATVVINADDRTKGPLRSIERSLGRIAGIAATAFGGRAVLQQINQYQNLTNKLKLVTNGTQELAVAQQRVFEIAQKTRAPFSETATLFQKLALNSKELGLSQEELLKVTETVNKSIAVSGADATQAAAGILQLSQAFASGRLQGDEFRSISENIPDILDRIARATGKPRGELKKLASEGKLTADVLAQSLLATVYRTDESFGKLDRTLAQSVTVATNNLTKFIGKLDEASGVSTVLGNAIVLLSENLVQVSLALGSFVAALVISKVAAFTKQVGGLKAAFILLNKAVLANPIIRLVAILTAASIAAYEFIKPLLQVEATFKNKIAFVLESFLMNIKGVFSAAGNVVSVFADAVFEALSLAFNLENPLKAFEGFGQKLGAAVKEGFQKAKGAGPLFMDPKEFDEIDAQIKRLKEAGGVTGGPGMTGGDGSGTLGAGEGTVSVGDGGASETLAGLKKIANALPRLRLDALSDIEAIEKEYADRVLIINQATEKQLKEAGIDRAEALKVLEENKAKRISEIRQREFEEAQELKEQEISAAIGFADEETRIQLELSARKKEIAEISNDTLLELGLNRIDLIEQAEKDAAERHKALMEQQTRDYEESMERRISAAMKAGDMSISAADKEFLQKKGKEERHEKLVKDRIEFEKKSEMQKTQFAIGQFGDLFEAFAAHNKKAFQAMKAARIAEAIINTYAAASEAFFRYGGFPFGAIAAAATVAAGFAQVQAIRSQTFQGRQRGGSLLTGQGAIVGEDGPELIVPKQPSTVIPREVADALDNMGGRREPVVVNFNITTVDAESFDTLLIRRRGTITSIINGALQKRGKEGVV